MGRTPAIRLGENVWRIPTSIRDYVNSYAFVDDDGQVTLVDTGLKSAPARIVAGLAAIGKQPQDVTRILLTHCHIDHASGAAELAERTGAPVAIGAADAEYLARGATPPIDTSTGMGRLMARLPARNWAPVAASQELHEGDEIPVAGGIRVLHTPGHTPGHVSLVHPASGVLITGDSLFNVLGGVRFSFAGFCTSAAQSRQTAARFADEDFRIAAFTHGPEIRDGAREKIRTFLNRR